MDEVDFVQVPKTIRDYVNIAGGRISLEALISDFKQAYETDIPFKEYGYPDVHSFLNSIQGIHLQKDEDEFYISSISRKKNFSGKVSDESSDLSQISFQMANNLVIGDKSGKRTVKMKSSSENTNLNARKSILSKMSLYSSSSGSGGSIESEANDIVNDDSLLLNASESSQLYQDFSDFPNSSVYGSSSNNYEMPNYRNAPEDFNYFKPSYQNSFENYNCSALPSYLKNPFYLLLIDLVNKYSLEYPVFETHTKVSPVDNSVSFNTILKVGNENFISPSYNDMSCDEIYVDLLKSTYESLKNRYEYHYINPQQDVVSNILEIINSNKHGATTEAINAAYFQKYHILPPSDWISSIENVSSVYVEPLRTKVMIYPFRAFLTVTPYSNSLPAKILPGMGTSTLNIYVSHCVNTSTIWFRILEDDYDIKYEILLTQMNKHYHGSVLSDVKAVNVGELYSCFFEGNWQRVEVLSKQGNIAKCRFIDSGITKELNFYCLFPLNHKFTNTSPLAFCCSMTDLSKYSTIDYISAKLTKILDKEIAIGKIESRSINELSMNIYLKNESFKVSVNNYILNQIRNEFHVPEITEIDRFFHVYLLSVDVSGVTQVQVESRSLQLLKESLNEASKRIEQNESQGSLSVASMLKLDVENIYLCKIDNSLERIKIKTIISGNKVHVHCIDSGDFITIDLRDVIRIDTLPDTLLHISPQCQTVKISIQDHTTQRIVNFMNYICSQTKSGTRNVVFGMKTLKVEKNIVVKFYKKQPNDEMTPLIDIYRNDCNQIMDMNFLNNLPDNRSFDLFSNVINSVVPKYDIKKGDILKVTVLKAQYPTNFTLKIENHPQFTDFTLNLNNYYLLFSPPPVSKINVNQCYAIQLENTFWYRGLVLFVMEDLKTVVVRLLDFAETVSVPISSVYPILPEFRSLPVQTINAKLLNVKPIHGEWTQQDCNRFKALVYKKILNCVIVDNMGSFCKVILLDGTNNGDMVNITTVLLNENRVIIEEA